MSNGIVEKQNSHRNLMRLASMRQLYSEAKIFLGGHAIALICFSLLSVLNIVYVKFFQEEGTGNPTSFSWLVASIGLLITVSDVFFISQKISDLKTKAAKIQEEFDTDVLSMPWNPILCGDRLPYEDIGLNSEKCKKDDLANWYATDVDKLPLPIARILCQRSNLCWDSALREKYLSRLKFIIGLVCLALLSLGLVANQSLQAFILNVVVPFSALIFFLIKQVNDHKKSIERNDKLKGKLDSCWSTILKNNNFTELEDTARRIQDIIFDVRKNNAMVFDFVYRKYRDSQERAMYFSINCMVEEYQSTSS